MRTIKEIEPNSYVAPAIDQDLYTPLYDWFTERIGVSSDSTYSVEKLLFCLVGLCVSYCQPELFNARLARMMTSLGFDLLEIAEFKGLVEVIKKQVGVKTVPDGLKSV